MDAVSDLLLRIREGAEPLAYQSGLDKSLRNDDAVWALERQQRRLELQLIDTACREAINTIQRHAPSWSASCLLTRPREGDVATALRLVKLAEVTMLSPTVGAYYEALRGRLPLAPTADIAVVALRLRVVTRDVWVSAASAAVHHARPQKSRLALGYSQRAIHLLRWVVLGLAKGANQDPDVVLDDDELLALVRSSFYSDVATSHRSQPPRGGLVLQVSSATAERVVSFLSSHSVILRSCGKFSAAVSMSLVAVRAAEVLRDEVALRFANVGRTDVSLTGDVGAQPSATFLLALTLFNAAACMEAVETEAPSRSVACAASIRQQCSRAQQYTTLRRCRELLTACGPEIGRDLFEVVSLKLSEHHHAAPARHPSPLARSRSSRVHGILNTVSNDANDTLHYFQLIAGRLSQEKRRWGSGPQGRRQPPLTANDRWEAVDAEAASLLAA